MYPGMGISLPNMLPSFPTFPNVRPHPASPARGHRALPKFNLPIREFLGEYGWVQGDGSTVWSKPVDSTLPLKRLNTKLARLGKGIRSWRREKDGDTRLQLAIVKEVLLQLKAAQENRLLTNQENELHRRLKTRSTELAAIEKSSIRQRSRLAYIRSGDANTKYFHIRASTRLRKNYIQSLHMDGGVAVVHNDKEKVVTDYF